MSKFKAENGNYYTLALFYETNTLPSKDGAIYTLKEEDIERDGRQYISLRKLYMSYDHIPGSEYDFANAHLGGWKHWLVLQESPKLKPSVEEWREELEVKLRCDSVKEVINVSRSEKGFQAAKWLAEGGYSPKKRGRPSAEEKARELRIQAGVHEEVDDIWNRIQ